MMKKEPLVSVIMNCYNGEKYLSEAIDSIYSQSYKNWEIIFWDNVSTDRSAEIAKSYDGRLKYFCGTENVKLGAARNNACELATGKYIAFLDCDDFWFENKLEDQVLQMEKNPEVGLVFGPVEFIVEPEVMMTKMAKHFAQWNFAPHPPKSIYKQLLLVGNRIIFSTLLIRRESYIRTGGIDESLCQNEDLDLILNIARELKAVCTKDVCGAYRVHKTNYSASQDGLGVIELESILRKLPKDRDVIKARKANFSIYSIYLLRKGNFIQAANMLLLKGDVLWLLKRMLNKISAISIVGYTVHEKKQASR
jgi:glycosyltransferase involved in cell wall biosynthesis